MTVISIEHRLGGFSMLELLVVLVIAGLLMGFVGPSFIGRFEQIQEKYAIDQFRTELAQLPRWTRLSGQRMSFKTLAEPLLIDGAEVLSLPEGWSAQFEPELVLLPSLVCSDATVKLLDANANELKRFDVKSPDCRVEELSL